MSWGLKPLAIPTRICSFAATRCSCILDAHSSRVAQLDGVRDPLVLGHRVPRAGHVHPVEVVAPVQVVNIGQLLAQQAVARHAGDQAVIRLVQPQEGAGIHNVAAKHLLLLRDDIPQSVDLGAVLPRKARGADTQQIQRLADLVDVNEGVHGGVGHQIFLRPLLHDEAVRHQSGDGDAHRRAAHVQLFAQIQLGDGRIGRIGKANDLRFYQLVGLVGLVVVGASSCHVDVLSAYRLRRRCAAVCDGRRRFCGTAHAGKRRRRASFMKFKIYYTIQMDWIQEILARKRTKIFFLTFYGKCAICFVERGPRCGSRRHDRR